MIRTLPGCVPPIRVTFLDEVQVSQRETTDRPVCQAAHDAHARRYVAHRHAVLDEEPDAGPGQALVNVLLDAETGHCCGRDYLQRAAVVLEKRRCFARGRRDAVPIQAMPETVPDAMPETVPEAVAPALREALGRLPGADWHPVCRADRIPLPAPQDC